MTLALIRTHLGQNRTLIENLSEVATVANFAALFRITKRQRRSFLSIEFLILFFFVGLALIIICQYHVACMLLATAMHKLSYHNG